MKLMEYWKFWKDYFKMEIMAHLAYPNQFVMFIFASLVFSAAGPIFAILIYSTGHGIPGWTFEEFLLFSGTVTLFSGLVLTFFVAQIWRIPRQIENGEFDKHLLRPIHMVPYTFLTGSDVDGFGNIIAGLVIIGYAIFAGNFHITLLSIMLYIILFILGILIEFCITLYIIGLSLLFVKSETIRQIMDTVFEFVRNPINIYSGFVQFIFTFIIPYSLATYYPVQALLGKVNPVYFVPIFAAVAVFMTFAIAFFNFTIKKYTSAGG